MKPTLADKNNKPPKLISKFNTFLYKCNSIDRSWGIPNMIRELIVDEIQ